MKGTEIILLGNKIDLVNEIAVNHEEAELIAKKHNIPFFKTSALNAENLDDAFKHMLTSILNNEELQEKIDIYKNIRLEEKRRSEVQMRSLDNCCQ